MAEFRNKDFQFRVSVVHNLPEVKRYLTEVMQEANECARTARKIADSLSNLLHGFACLDFGEEE